MVIEERKSFCRICNGGCGVILKVNERERIVGIRANQESLLTKGYACFKGLQAIEAHYGSARLLHPLKKQSGGNFSQIDSEKAIDEISVKIADIIATFGPESVAVFSGNGALFNISAYFMHRSFLDAIGSDQYFSTLTIDQSAKTVAFGRLGGWDAGYPSFDDMEVALMIGANPLVTHGTLNFISVDPVRRLKAARAKGLKLIVVDPRITETGRNADLMLQPYPGQDPAILGGLIRLILREDWHDAQFCAAHVGVQRMDDLWRAVAPLTEELVETRAGLKRGQIRAVAELFARDSRIGCATMATGPCMAPFSNLSAHLAETLNVICGRFLRAGQRRHNTSATWAPKPAYAEVIPASRGWEQWGPSRIRGMHSLWGERPSGTLSDEILTAGKGQIRALIVDGGDLITSLPDQFKTAKALQSLDLLVCIDPWRSTTSHYAHYVLPSVMQYERADLPMTIADYVCWPGAWQQYTPAVVPPPSDSDVVEDWYVFWAIARRLGRSITYNGVPLDMQKRPCCDDLLGAVVQNGLMTIEELKAFPSGIDIPVDDHYILPARPEAQGNQFDPMPRDVGAELSDFISKAAPVLDPNPDRACFSHFLTSRRMRHLFNSTGRNVSTVRERTPYNPAFLNSREIAQLGVKEGDRIQITSAHGCVTAVVGVDDAVRDGVVSIAHGWGGLPHLAQSPYDEGTPVNALIDTDQNFESINAMPHMSAVPVKITRFAAEARTPICPLTDLQN